MVGWLACQSCQLLTNLQPTMCASRSMPTKRRICRGLSFRRQTKNTIKRRRAVNGLVWNSWQSRNTEYVRRRRVMQKARVAIATLWDGNPDYSCAVLPWCQHARKFASLVGNAELLLLLASDGATRAAAAQATLLSDCPGIRVHTPDPRLKSTVHAFARRGMCRDLRHGPDRARNFVRVAPLPMMFKWWVASLDQYQLIVFADLDVQLLRSEQPLDAIVERWKAGWTEVVPPDGSARVLGSPDSQSPFNAGLWTLGNPSATLYETGLHQMRTAPFNGTHGFGLLGSPRKLVRERPYLFASLHPTRAWKRDLWSNTGLPFMDCDQGFLYFVFYLLLGIGRQAGQQLRSASGWECQQLEQQLWGGTGPG